MGALRWQSHAWKGSAADFHSADLPAERGVWLCTPDSPALVLGSSQSDDDVDVTRATDAMIDVARRRTGGGAVFVHPEDSIWIDIVIPRDDPLWVDDVGRSTAWLGHAWVDALGDLHDGSALVVHDAADDPGEWGSVVCFAGAAPGEVFVVGADGVRSKLVGISQRRGRHGARFQCIVHRSWRPDVWSHLLTRPGARTGAMALRVGITPAPATEVLDALLRSLASVGAVNPGKKAPVTGDSGVENKGVGGG